jgi:predicted AAA+ superfamily ATPase
MNFEAFLLALGKKYLLEFLQQYKLGEEIPITLHQTLLEHIKIYFLVGGLPEVVAKYATTENFIDIERIKKSLLVGYQEDFSKYASLAEQQRMRLIFNKVPRMLGEKFKYSHIDPEQKSTLIKTAVERLNLARIIHIVYHTDGNGIPLDAEINEKNFKTYFLDIGLISSSLNLNILDFKDIHDFTMINAGKIAEQFVAQELLQFRELYEQPALYYWLREAKSSSAEIDFVIPFHSKIIPIEVKAGATGTLKSLHYFLTSKELPIGVRFCNQLPSVFNGTLEGKSGSFPYKLLTLPFYLIGQLRRVLEQNDGSISS